ncbi:MAG TPA: alanine--glyoxylate aminotransferase family protein [Nitrospiria bacterium]|nr:alanine--glyoxylate aminotransferase family protein [Nitrospiria bacterium]
MILLNPGPVNVSPRVQQALLRGDICHREEEFSALLRRIRERLISIFGGPGYTSVVLTGSGTAALEAAVVSSLPEGKKLLVIKNGVYGERIAAMARAHRLPVVEFSSQWTERPETTRLADLLKKEREVAVVAMVHHETTTGLINPVRAVGKICREKGKLFLVDSISGLGGEEIDPLEEGIDLCVGTANKCVQGLPGISFVLARTDRMREMAGHPERSLYLHLPRYYEEQELGSIPYTPSVQICYALDEALQELLEEGVARRIRRYRQASGLLRKGFSELGLTFLLPEALRSNTITALRLPEGRTYADLHDQLKKRGYVIYAGQGDLSREIFRVANMGHLPLSAFEGFLVSLSEILKKSA